MGTSVQVHSHRDKGLSPGQLGLGPREAPDNSIPYPPAHSLFLSGRGNPSAWRDLGSGLGVTWLRRGAGRRPPPEGVSSHSGLAALEVLGSAGKAEQAERQAQVAVSPAATAVALRKGLGALRWSESP